MNTLLNCIKEQPIILEQYAQEIKGKKRPLIMYGAGCWAKQQYQMLAAFGVIFDGVGVDEKYWKSNDSYFDLKINPIEALTKKYPEAALWIGFNLDRESFSSLKKRIQSTLGFTCIYACDCARFDQFENHNYKYSQIKEHIDQFQWLFDRLADEKSKQTLISYLNQRISGDYQYSENIYDEHHYFAKDIVHLGQEVFVDCGAYTGDTIQSLYALTTPKKVFAFEPEKANFEKLQKNYIHDARVVCLNIGAYSKKTTLSFSANCTHASKINEHGESKIETDTIDHVTQGESVTFIKMDIEGAELEALKGAAETIQAHHPKLAISAYHQFEDLFTLPQYIDSLNSKYKFYLRRHSYLVHELVLYAL